MNGKLALTLSPPLRKGAPTYLFRKDVLETLSALLKCSSDFEIYPEFADNGRLHYHGVVLVNDYVKWYKSVLPRLNYSGFVCIKTKINDGWDTYIKKNWGVTKDVLDLIDPVGPEYIQDEIKKQKQIKSLLADKVKSLDQKAKELTLVERLNAPISN